MLTAVIKPSEKAHKKFQVYTWQNTKIKVPLTTTALHKFVRKSCWASDIPTYPGRSAIIYITSQNPPLKRERNSEIHGWQKLRKNVKFNINSYPDDFFIPLPRRDATQHLSRRFQSLRPPSLLNMAAFRLYPAYAPYIGYL